VEAGENGIDLIGVGMDLWAEPELPTVVPVHAAVSIECTYYEIADNASAPLIVAVRSPNLETLVRWEKRFRLAGVGSEDFPEGWDGKRVVGFEFQFTAATEGTYSIDFTLDGNAPVTATLRVLRR
jgi:hypothetical protein